MRERSGKSGPRKDVRVGLRSGLDGRGRQRVLRPRAAGDTVALQPGLLADQQTKKPDTAFGLTR
jgi:hypothetical protein